MEVVGDLCALPEGCIANVVSFTGPRDACSLSLVCSLFKSAAESDAVWERFLPPDYRAIISRSSDPSLLSRCPSKKHLFLSLSRSPLLIDSGDKSFWLDKWSGKKCFMISARDLRIVWGDTPAYWSWISNPDSRFAEVAELLHVCWLEIRGWICVSLLSPTTLYAAYLVFKSTEGLYGFERQLLDVTVGLVGGESFPRTVCLDFEGGERRQRYQIVRRGVGMFNLGCIVDAQVPAPLVGNAIYPKKRGDGWLEIELGEFFNKEGEDGELEMSVLEIKGGNWKGGIIVQGIEIRPKYGK